LTGEVHLTGESTVALCSIRMEKRAPEETLPLKRGSRSHVAGGNGGEDGGEAGDESAAALPFESRRPAMGPDLQLEPGGPEPVEATDQRQERQARLEPGVATTAVVSMQLSEAAAERRCAWPPRCEGGCFCGQRAMRSASGVCLPRSAVVRTCAANGGWGVESRAGPNSAERCCARKPPPGGSLALAFAGGPKRAKLPPSKLAILTTECAATGKWHELKVPGACGARGVSTVARYLGLNLGGLDVPQRTAEAAGATWPPGS